MAFYCCIYIGIMIGLILEPCFIFYVWGFIIIYWSWGDIQTQSHIYARQVFYHWLVSPAPRLIYFLFLFIYFLIVCRHVCLHVSVWMRVKIPWEARGIRSLGRGVIYGCELPDLGSGNQTLVFWRTRKFSYLVSHLSRTGFFTSFCFLRGGWNTIL